MRRFLVSQIHEPSAVKIIDADGFEVEESGYTVFYDENSSLVARFINCNVEPYSPSKETSDEVASVAAKYLNFGAKNLQKAMVNDPEGLCNDIQTLAGSCLSQAEGND